MTFRRTLTVAALGFLAAGGAQAQTALENRDADALAADMRILAANPLDIEALIVAGELTLRMGDTTASAGFFSRAEKLDPNNPRIKAGWGSLMVRAERPGMALLRFQEAERRGLDPRKFAADRGLAYDLIGQSERAQRDYRLALASGPDDEVTRRYALSLGIVGQKEAALKLLDPLLRQSDRAAWRDRAFVLAMSGDTDGAEKIAATMMSPGLGAGLTPFFRRLPQLSAVDRAFAVNFGELRTTPERVADAQLVPPLPRLGPDPYAPKVVVAVAPVAAIAEEDGRKRRKRKKDRLAPAVPPVETPPVEVALAPPRYVPPTATAAPSYTSPSYAPVRAAPAPTPAPAPVPRPTPAPVPPPVRVAVAAPIPTPTSSAATVPYRATDSVTPTPPPASVPAASPPVVVAANTGPAPTPPIVIAPAIAPAVPSTPAIGVTDQPSAAEAGIPQPTATARVSEDTVLARIVAGLDKRPVAVVAPPRRATVSPAIVEPAASEPKTVPRSGRSRSKADDEVLAASTTTTGKGKVKGKSPSQVDEEATASSVTAKGKRDKTRQDLADADDAKGRAGKTAKDDAPPLDKNGCPIPVKGAKGKAATAAKPATTARGRANEARCKALADKTKADAATKGETARVWVQVAGGANEGDLRKAWAALQAKAPDLFRGRQGWTTPLRATNRVLTGPFKTEDEAQAFVNRLSRAGLSGFVFTSAKGQKIERLGSK